MISASQKLISMKAPDEESEKIQARAKFEIGKAEAQDAQTAKPMEAKNLFKATNDLLLKYEKSKALLLAPCEAGGSQWCSAGHYEVSKLADGVSKIIAEVEPPPSIKPAEANKVMNLVNPSKEKLQNDTRNFAASAEQAIAQGVPDEEWAERIRLWAQVQRGENQVVDPQPK